MGATDLLEIVLQDAEKRGYAVRKRGMTAEIRSRDGIGTTQQQGMEIRVVNNAGLKFSPQKRLRKTKVLLVPGYSCVGEHLGQIAIELAKRGVEAHVLLLPGQGIPQSKKGRGPNEYVRHVADYAEQIADGPVLLVGHSLEANWSNTSAKSSRRGESTLKRHISTPQARERA